MIHIQRYWHTAEAGDVIVALVRRDDPDRRVWIMSGDRDFHQLIDGRIRVLNTAMKRGRRHIESDTVFDRYQVQPTQWADFRVLTGDPADNIPGVRGVGTGTSAKLLAGGLTFDQLADAGRLIGSKGAAVVEAWDQVLGWRDLIRMRTELDLPLLPTGRSSRALPEPAEVIEKLGLW